MYEISQHNITSNIIKINIKLNCKTLDIILEWNYDEVGKLNWVGLITNMKTLHSPKEYSLHVVGLLLLNAAQIVLTPPAPRNGGPFLPFFGQAGQVDPLVGWRCCY